MLAQMLPDEYEQKKTSKKCESAGLLLGTWKRPTRFNDSEKLRIVRLEKVQKMLS